MTTRYTYEHLIELVDGDRELIALLVEHGVIERRGDDRALVDVDVVLVARTLLRELEVGWPGVEVILRMRRDLVRAQQRIAELEAQINK